ncbi:MAG: hypothetical protein NVV62_04385 [Terricaulis sp.]|nr:hypothetical protein [Terricaulis sp.]
MQARRGLNWNIDAVALFAVAAALVCAAPAIAVVGFALAPGESARFGGALLRDGVIGTLSLTLAGGAGAIALGATSAWLVSLTRFPGRGVFEWLLVIPLAAPSYVLAYAYSGLTWAGGPIPFPLRGFWGATLVYAIGLYPYVYLAARAAFASQSACALEAARTLGGKTRRAVFPRWLAAGAAGDCGGRRAGADGNRRRLRRG